MAAIICCGREVKSHKGKTPKCPWCGTEFQVIRPAPEPVRSYKKVGVENHRTPGEMFRDAAVIFGTLIALLVLSGVWHWIQSIFGGG